MVRRSRGRRLAREDEPDLQVTRARGSHVYDQRGREYVDFVMGWCVGNLGWSHPRLAGALRGFRGPDYVMPSQAYPPWERLARQLVSMAPGKLARAFRATGGSEAVDLALQAAMLRTGRRRFLSLDESYHGNTLAALGVGASAAVEGLPGGAVSCERIAAPLDERALRTIETRVRREDVAAFVMEPTPINLGVLIPERERMLELQRLCRRHGTLLVMDEVATGFGRTGALFATEHYGVEPDLLALGKALTGGALGMGALLATEPVARAMEREGSFWSTYGWHPRSVAVAAAAVEVYRSTWSRLRRRIERTSALFRERLEAMPFRALRELRIQGLAIGVDLGDERYAARIRERARREGLLVSAEGGTLLLLPALNVERGVASKGLAILARCV